MPPRHNKIKKRNAHKRSFILYYANLISTSKNSTKKHIEWYNLSSDVLYEKELM